MKLWVWSIQCGVPCDFSGLISACNDTRGWWWESLVDPHRHYRCFVLKWLVFIMAFLTVWFLHFFGAHWIWIAMLVILRYFQFLWRKNKKLVFFFTFLCFFSFISISKKQAASWPTFCCRTRQVKKINNNENLTYILPFLHIIEKKNFSNKKSILEL